MKKYKNILKKSCVFMIILSISLFSLTAFAAEENDGFSSSDIKYTNNNAASVQDSVKNWTFYRRFVSIYNWYLLDSSQTSYAQSYSTTWLPLYVDSSTMEYDVMFNVFKGVFEIAGLTDAYEGVPTADSARPYLLCYFDPNTNESVWNIIHKSKTSGSNTGVYGYKIAQGKISSTNKYYQVLQANNISGSNSCIYQVRIPSNWNGSAASLTRKFTSNSEDVLFAYQNILICSKEFENLLSSNINVTIDKRTMPNYYSINFFNDIAYVYLDGPTVTTANSNFTNVNVPLANKDPFDDNTYYLNFYFCTYLDVDPVLLSDFLYKSNFFRFESNRAIITKYDVSSSTDITTSKGQVLVRYSVKLYFTYTFETTDSYHILHIYRNWFESVQFDSIGTLTYGEDPSAGIYGIAFRGSQGTSGDIEVEWDKLSSGFNFLQMLVNRVYLILPPEIYSVFVVSFTVIMLLALLRLVTT